MNELKLSLEKAKELEDGRKLSIYTIADYTVRVVDYGSFKSVSTQRTERKEFLPEIYCRDDMEGNILGFEIQTTSYGAITVEEIQKMMKALKEAVEVVKVLEKEFVK